MTERSDDKKSLLEQLLRKRPSTTQQICAAAASGPHPASYAQERLWFLDQLAPDGFSYNIFAPVWLSGPLDVGALERSLFEIVRRHEALRTRFIAPEGRPLQVIAPPGPVPLPIVQLADLGADEREREVGRLAEEEARRPFALASDLLLRASLLRLAPEEHVVFLTMHHIGSDGWSLGIFVQELATLYRAFSLGERSPLPDLPIQYSDFSKWQRGWLESGVLAQQLVFWKKQLAGLPPLLALPTDRPRPTIQSNRGARCPVAIPAALTTALKGLCQREHATPFMALLAAFQALLARHSGQSDVAVGSPIANRRRETEPLIGFFVNTLVLRTDVSGEPTFRELLARVREVTLEAYAHQDAPFERLVEELRPARNMGHQPLFQVMLVLQNVPAQSLALGQLRIEILPVKLGTSKFDLLLSLDETDGQFSGHLEYATDLFDRSTVERIVGHFLRLLEGAVAEPDRPVSSLPLLLEQERQRVLHAWNQPRSTAAPARAVHRLFEEQVTRTPDATAVVFAGDGSARLSYRELECRANQLAHHLARLGVGADVPVAISIERSLEMVIAVLAVLKAGGACVPLDPAYPKARLAFMLGDTRAPVIVTQRRLVAELPPHHGHLVLVDEWDAIAHESGDALAMAPEADHLAYVIYTSGSTGRPKGIALPHRALTNLTEWDQEVRVHGARTLQFASLNFDVSFLEILATLSTGGELHVIPESLRRDARALARYIDRAGLEKIIVPVIVLQQMAEAFCETDGTFARLREVTTTGEQLQITRPIVRLFKRCPHIRFHNLYGPSETHVVTGLILGDDPDAWPMHPSIGHAIRGTQTYVLDPHGEPAPLGVVGELYLGGVMLARGYHGRPGLTAEKFVPDPFSDPPGGRVYRTGDLARLLPDGQIQFLGRADHQVKIRGFRVELGEVEAVLGQHPGVREGIVIALDDPAGKKLVAYLVPEAVPAPSVTELRRFLGRQLPDHMIPSAFIILDALPLTANGKVDRRALPAPDAARPALDRSYVAPRTSTEWLLADIWQRTLGVEKIGIEDGFFDLGGHSLLAVQVVTRVRAATRMHVPLQALFESPSVRAMAETVDRLLAEASRRRDALQEEIVASVRAMTDEDVHRRLQGVELVEEPACAAGSPERSALVAHLTREASGSMAPAISVRADRTRFPISFNQHAIWSFTQSYPQSRFNNLGGGLLVEGSLDRDALERALAEVVRRHEVLRARFVQTLSGLEQVIMPPAPVLTATIDLGDLPEAEREPRATEWARAEASRPFDLEAGGLIRGAIARLSEERHMLVLVVHHIAFDGFSAEIFFRELGVLYGSYANKAPHDLPPLALQYADFAEWQRGLATSPAGIVEIDWWKQHLEGFRPIPFPTGAPPRAPSPSSAGTVEWSIAPELFEGLQRLQQRERVSLLVPMLAGFMIALHLVSERDDIAVGNSYVYRDWPGTTGVIGFFSKPFVVRARVEGGMSLRAVIGGVRDAVLVARTHDQTQINLIPGATDAYRINFNFLPPPALPVLPGLRVARLIPVSHDETLFDLAIFMQARGSGLTGQVMYRDQTSARAEVVAFCELYRRVLEAMAEDPELLVGSLRRR